MAETIPKSWAYVDELIDEHMEYTKKSQGHKSRLKQLVRIILPLHNPHPQKEERKKGKTRNGKKRKMKEDEI